MREVSDYQPTLDSVIQKGQDLIAASPHLPQLISHTETQLGNLTDSYNSLKATGEQIKVGKRVTCGSGHLLRDIMSSVSCHLSEHQNTRN